MTLRGRVLFITGASRGIGLAMALRAARDGARIVIAAKTAEPHPKLPGTIHTAAADIRAAGGEALPIQCDVRSAEQVESAVAQAVAAFGAIDVCINNASALALTGTLETPVKSFDLMNQINYRGAWLAARACLPHLLAAPEPHILNIAPPLDLAPRWFAPHAAYTIAKYDMSLLTLGLAGEFAGRVAVNSLWPRTLIATAAVSNILGPELMRETRRPEIMADAAYRVLTLTPAPTGRFFIDEDVLREAGVTDFDAYATVPGAMPRPDIFIEG
jgi:citronellol/citronellal dehydrogenase